MTTYTVNSGQTWAGTLNTGDELDILSGGKATGTIVNGGGSENIHSGGIASGSIVNSGGSENIQGGISSGSIVNSGGRLSIDLISGSQVTGANGEYVINGNIVHSGAILGLALKSGVSISGLTLNSNGYLNIYAGGSANDIIINSGGSENISSGGIAISTVVNSGGFAIIHSGGIASGTIVNSSGSEIIHSGGIASGSIVNNGGSENIQLGGIANGSIVNSGGRLNIDLSSGSQVTGANGEYVINGNSVHSGAILGLTLESGIAVSGLIINSGGYLAISSGGIASDCTINSGGYLMSHLSSGSKVTGANGEYVINGITTHSGALLGLTLESGVAVSGLIINSGSRFLQINSGGIANSTILTDSILTINSGGIANGTILNSEHSFNINIGLEVVHSGGISIGTIINNGGVESIWSGGIASGTVVNNGGHLSIVSDCFANGTVVNNGGIFDIRINSDSTVTGDNGEYVINGNTIHSGGILNLNVDSGVAVSGLTLNVNENLRILSGGIASNSIINSGGSEVILSGGITSGSVVNSGGTFNIALSSGSKITGANSEYIINGNTIHSGAILDLTIESGVAVSGLIINSGGSLNIHSGGIASGSIVNSGGTLGMDLISGSTVTGANGEYVINGNIVHSGAILDLSIESGGAVSGLTLTSGSILQINTGGLASDSVVNSGGIESIDVGGLATGIVVNSGGTISIVSVSTNVSFGSISYNYYFDLTTLNNITLNDGAIIDYSSIVTDAVINDLNQLVLTSGGVVKETIGLAGNYSGVHFVTSDDGNGGTLITEVVNNTPNVASFLSNLSLISDSGFAITDTSSNIAANLGSLQTNIAKLSSITVTDTGAITLAAAQSLADHAVLAKISGAYNLTVTGTSSADNLFDTATSHATLTGGVGVDAFNVTGTDSITDLGKGGADILKVSAGGIANARINEAWTASSDSINNGTVNISTAGLAVNLSAIINGSSGYKITDTGGAAKLICSALDDLIIGGTGKDTLIGGLGKDILKGAAGNDLLIGGLGNDTLTGGTGNDFFVFNTKPNNKNNVDKIADFASGKDHLQFSKAIFAGLHSVAGAGTAIKATEFISSPTATHGTTANSHLIYNSTSGILYYDADGNGAGAAVKVAILGTHPALVASDILIIA